VEGSASGESVSAHLPPKRDAADSVASELHGLLRPLSSVGEEQAAALADHVLESAPPKRLIAGPALRCQQTLEPLALALDLGIEVDERLGEHEDVSVLLPLLTELSREPAVLCTHSRSISALLEQLELVDAGELTGSVCRKGSLWTLEGPGPQPERATYAEPAPLRKDGRPRSALSHEVARPRSVRAAVLDMGSTSFTLLIADVTRGGSIRPVVREKVMLRLGAVVAAHEKVPGEEARRAVAVARDLREVVRREKVARFVPVATAVLRDARNGAKVADKIGRALGEPVRILEGEAEARLIFGAFQRRLELGDDPVLGLDLGGGSLELAVGCGRRIDAEVTLPLGAVRLHGEMCPSDPMRRSEVRRIRERVREAMAPHLDALARRAPDRIVAAGGTARALAQMLSADRGLGSTSAALPLDVSIDEIRSLTERLTTATHEERLSMPGMRRRRADLLPTGALVILGAAEELGIDRFTLCDWGLREGVLLDAIAGLAS
jgi:exopolyphosphatase/guanosine-5'-triphosphate,3'-diphosphate pyrophosphatase